MDAAPLHAQEDSVLRDDQSPFLMGRRLSQCVTLSFQAQTSKALPITLEQRFAAHILSAYLPASFAVQFCHIQVREAQVTRHCSTSSVSTAREEAGGRDRGHSCSPESSTPTGARRTSNADSSDSERLRAAPTLSARCTACSAEAAAMMRGIEFAVSDTCA